MSGHAEIALQRHSEDFHAGDSLDARCRRGGRSLGASSSDNHGHGFCGIEAKIIVGSPASYVVEFDLDGIGVVSGHSADPLMPAVVEGGGALEPLRLITMAMVFVGLRRRLPILKKYCVTYTELI